MQYFRAAALLIVFALIITVANGQQQLGWAEDYLRDSTAAYYHAYWLRHRNDKTEITIWTIIPTQPSKPCKPRILVIPVPVPMPPHEPYIPQHQGPRIA